MLFRSKPHLVRYNERIRIAGKLIEDELLAALLKEVLDAGEGLEPSFFEVTTVATFLAYARHPADACVIETGLGGRLDATNVMPTAAVCARLADANSVSANASAIFISCTPIRTCAARGSASGSCWG